MLVSIVIPARDEASSIVKLIPHIKAVLGGMSYEIIIVDDGSKDGTREAAINHETIVVTHKENMGKGAAMKSGVMNSHGDVIVFLDGDGAHESKDITKLIIPVLQGKADMVIGSRFLRDSLIVTAPLTRRLSNQLASLFISVVISFILPLASLFKCPIKWTRITDCTSGYRVIKRESWQKLHLISEGFQIETEMVYEAAKNGLLIVEVPITCTWRSQISHLSILRDGSRTLKLLAWKLVLDANRRSGNHSKVKAR